jgi:sugar transferase (PEP-CTERM/EpsH1 system associated)
MDILFLSHCVPNPPDKGEKIRAWHELNALAEKHRVHLACFARSQGEVAKAYELRDRCASVFAQLVSPTLDLVCAGFRFIAGGCLNTDFYRNAPMRRHIASRNSVAATLAYSSAVVQFAPQGIPLWIDMVDVDSEKWLEYGQRRWPGPIYSLEGRRLRSREAEYAKRAECTFVTTPREQRILQQIAPGARVETFINGVDFNFFDPQLRSADANSENRKYLVFVGQMDYFPNVDACCWFAKEVFPALRAERPDLEFLIVGRSPSGPVCSLADVPGVSVVGGVADVRPYLAHSLALAAPLRIARGVQNKVLEALAMGKRVLASPAVASTFGSSVPLGLTICESTTEYAAGLSGLSASWDPEIRRQAQQRFCWERNLTAITDEMNQAAGARVPA